MIYFILYSKLKTMETDIKKTFKKKTLAQKRCNSVYAIKYNNKLDKCMS